MDLIINPTNKCNFSCDFCSARNLTNKTLTTEETITFLKKYGNNIGMVIINGGDPLMMHPQYYYDILEYLKLNIDHKVYLSLTTNLYDWKLNPKKWDKLFNDSYVGIMTSFQYGNKRKLYNKEVFSESMFIDIIKQFNERYQYKPNFISVIDSENENEILKTLMLAQKLGIKCKINKVLQLGAAKDNCDYYPLYKLFKKYIEIIDNRLDDYCLNIENLKNLFRGNNTYCPYKRDCHYSIRCLNNDNKIYSCGNLATEKQFDEYNLNNKNSKPEDFAKKNEIVSFKCLCCDNFKICNGCHIMIYEAKQNKDIAYCEKMKEVIPQLKKRLL